MDYFEIEAKETMRCTIQGCPGRYEKKTVVHTVKLRRNVVVIDHVPAEVCDVCGDVLFAPETVRRIEKLLRRPPQAAKEIPLYEFA